MTDEHGQTTRIDFVDLIRDPYQACPACSEVAFGIFEVAGHSFSRSCKSCRHTANFSLPALQKTVLYLDQFVVSNIAKALDPNLKVSKTSPHHHFWIEVFRRLERLVKGQIVVCPHSDFHWHESRLGNYPRSHRRLYEHLSGGTSFRGRGEIEIFQLFIAARRWCDLETERFETNWSSILGNFNAWSDTIGLTIENREEIWEQHQPQAEMKEHRAAAHESFLSVFAKWQQTPRSFERLFEREVTETIKGVSRDLVAGRDRWTGEVSGAPPLAGGIGFPFYLSDKAKAVIRVLGEASVPAAELLDRALEFFESTEFQGLPYVRISAAMFAELGCRAGKGRRKRPTPGFVTDVTMLSTFMPYCDAVFIDKECDGILSTPRVSSQVACDARFFSLRDTRAFLTYLDELEGTMTSEHLSTLEAVYGPDWDEPYETIFEDR